MRLDSRVDNEPNGIKGGVDKVDGTTEGVGRGSNGNSGTHALQRGV